MFDYTMHDLQLAGTFFVIGVLFAAIVIGAFINPYDVTIADPETEDPNKPEIDQLLDGNSEFANRIG
jgi:hypothetical protein